MYPMDHVTHPARARRWGLALAVAMGAILAAVWAFVAYADGRPSEPPASPSAAAVVGPGPVQQTVVVHGYRIELRLSPNEATSIGSFSVRLLRHGRPVEGASVLLTTMMTTMRMGYRGRLLPRGSSGLYVHAWPPLDMTGRWRMHYAIHPPGDEAFTVTLIDDVA